MKQVHVPIVTHKLCKKRNNVLYQELKVQEKMHICAGYGNKGNEYACDGDSGGSLLQQNNKLWYATGVISWIDPTCNSTRQGSFTVLTRISSYEKWIGNNIDVTYSGT